MHVDCWRQVSGTMEISFKGKIIICVLLSLLNSDKGQALSVPNVNKHKDVSISYRLPTELKDGTIVKINGKLWIDSILQILLSSKDEDVSYCSVEFIPRKEVIIQTTNKYPYILHHLQGDSITFTLQMDARALDKDIIEMYFESNGAGVHTLDPCVIDSFNNADKIVLKGVKRVDNLNFTYPELL